MPAAKSAPGSSLAIAAKKAATTGKVAATKTATKAAPKVLATPKTSTTTAQDVQNLQKAREALRLDDIASRQQQEELPVMDVTQAPAWSLETDPLYSSAMAAGQAQFNYARNAALADKQTQELGLSNQRKALDTTAAEARRRTAGNYAARGMAGGAAGALSLAEARANAEQVAARTGIADQITALNNNFLQNYGDVFSKDAAGKSNFDWTGTLTGQQYKTQAAQQALEAALSRLGTV